MNQMSNRLASETSPYLLQHKDNPVDWYPWGSEALERARTESKPILLSIGYAACHWCHVMEHESFEDPETAALMNEHFVCVKVDREERPDLDAVYMEAVQSMTGRGGWPMTVFLTPEGEPFYGGTYFPPEDRHGMPGFPKLLDAIALAWTNRRPQVLDQGQRLSEHIASQSKLVPSEDVVGASLLVTALENAREAFDPEWGGFGSAPKFPQPMNVDLMLRLGKRGHPEALDIATRTLDAMAGGGMFDQLGGGFARYSVDRYWLVPHFEKMLYDNAQLLRTYADAYLITGIERYARVARMTAAWMLKEMRDPNGGFWSSLDADSEGEEGLFYIWTLAELEDALGADAPAALAHWGASAEGNFEGRNILVWASDPADETALDGWRTTLLAARDRRVRPATDDKVLAGWNGLAATGLARAGAALGQTDWIQAAAGAMDFVLSTIGSDGRLIRSVRQGAGGQTAFADDYALCLEACLALYEATAERRWLDHARSLADTALELFHDDENGGFFLTAHDSEALVARPKELVDNAIPAANSVFALELQRLALMTGELSYEKAALSALRLVRDGMVRSPLAFGHALQAVDFFSGEGQEIVLVGDPSEPDTRALMTVVHNTYLPNKVLITSGETDLPLLKDRERIDGKPTAFVCRRGACKLPVTSVEALKQQLSGD